ncbi:antitoxin [Mycolicibacterium phlei]|jgi:peroxiredoxin|uniref:Kanamycin biosynthetic protein n=1 Tax=Mycolicibacterium phlei DSM 43239 = CCUG 21000 TaxID=1226750 RepID=A0A5N5UV41_MYCPH|nr:antitoxin [Mycolicibacterium phlei]VEG07796.1 antitoxin [Mycobacteroides chelonae]AMO59667.1 Antitoxin [Mycolicibacterium phlei]EID10697.1 hypothetical protein MPHLEI_21279 [Mycolicibacterium phlei RIVM601174]KAB7753491.1 kanamycin biosynthetic protein [Mycolicibacterium phlei DSM 43239 = CCUG 21000]KXW62394.1 kanamycin biosynthetic protein [Mycolicibacterium phlei DSM 43239 = CCUG 21000]
MSFLDKAKDLLAKNADKVETVIEKAGDIVDEKTEGKFAQHVDKVQEAAKNAAKNYVENLDNTENNPQS